jgi:transposase
MKSNQDLKSHKQYAHIPTVVPLPLSQTRIKLIKLVLERSASIAKAASKLSLSLSTAKLIVKRFKTTGTIFQKRNEAT